MNRGLVEITMKKYMPPLHKSLGVYLPLITTNCAVLGVAIMNIDKGFGFVQSLVNAVGAGVGFMVAMILFAGVRGKMETCDIPEAFKGVPSVLIAASILAMSFMGFAGIVEGIFGRTYIFYRRVLSCAQNIANLSPPPSMAESEQTWISVLSSSMTRLSTRFT